MNLPKSYTSLRPRTVEAPVRRRAVLRAATGAGCLALLAAGALPVPAWATVIELLRLEGKRVEPGVSIESEVRFELPPGVEDALQKGVALNFVAEVEVYRSRWYWRDARIARATRTWRLSYQPLTFTFKVSFGGLSQTYKSLGEALRVIQRPPSWRLADVQFEEDSRFYLEYSFKLDTNQLPRPMLIGVSGQAEWNLLVERTVPLSPELR